MKHYHPSLDVHSMPEYVFEHEQNPGSLYTPLYQYFLMRWEELNIPGYDFETDELVYRDEAGNEKAREKFDEVQPGVFSSGDGHFVSKTDIPTSGGSSTPESGQFA